MRNNGSNLNAHLKSHFFLSDEQLTEKCGYCIEDTERFLSVHLIILKDYLLDSTIQNRFTLYNHRQRH